MNKEKLIEQVNLGLSTWKLASYFNTTQPNIRYWLRKYNISTIRKMNLFNNQRICLSCKITKSKDDFYKRGKKYMSHCKDCHKNNYSLKRQAVKLQAVKYLGGKCSKCGYFKCIAALDFHHTNPHSKDKNYINLKNFFSDKLKTELDKCVLLCANCHREEHHLS